MSMESSREQAKRAVTKKEKQDPELDGALSDATNFRLQLKKEDNRHLEAINRQNLGFIGQLFGDGKSLPGTAALVALLFGLLAVIGCLIIVAFMNQDPEMVDFWSKQAERALGFAAVALSYIFGKSSK